MRLENSYQKERSGRMRKKGGLLDEYLQSLTGRADSTLETYRRELGPFLRWIGERSHTRVYRGMATESRSKVRVVRRLGRGNN